MATIRTTAQTCWFPLVLLLLVFLSGCKTPKLKDAELADATGRYHLAASTYSKLYRKTKRNEPEQKAYLAYKAAENYRRLGQVQRALNLYHSALNYGFPDSLVTIAIAQQYHVIGKTKEAKETYERYLALYPNSFWAQQGLQSIEQAQMLSSNPFRFQVTPEKLFTSSRSDFGGAFSAGGDLFYFASSRSRNPDIALSEVTGEKLNHLYISRRNAEGKWQRPDSLAGGVNATHDMGAIALSPDGSTLYYTQVEQSDERAHTAKIYRSSRSGDGGYSSGIMLELWTDTLRMAAQPAIDGSGNTLYFVSQGGYGGKDLYSIPLANIGATVPTNLGPVINTPGDEMYPTMVGDSVLYFASSGHLGLGGLDIYRARLDSTGSWQLTHLGAPINSSADDFAFTPTPVPDEGLAMAGIFSSTRNDGRGYPHLFRFCIASISTLLEGQVFSREGEPIVGAQIQLVSENTPLVPRSVLSRELGRYSMSLEGSTEYLLLAGAPGYLNQYISFQTDPANEDLVYSIDFYLPSRVKPEVFQDIYYDFDKASLRPESRKDLDAMAKILHENPEIIVEISAHADRKGPDAYNIALSERRAQAVVDYLLAQEIAPERLVAKGYGKSHPRSLTPKLKEQYPQLSAYEALTEEIIGQLSGEDQAIADQLNRRTEFRVLETLPSEPEAAPQESIQEEPPTEGSTPNEETDISTTSPTTDEPIIQD